MSHRLSISGPLPVVDAVRDAKNYGHIYCSLATLAGGTSFKVQCKRGGYWADDTGTAIAAANATFVIQPCDAWRLVAVAGAPTYTGGWIALPA